MKTTKPVKRLAATAPPSFSINDVLAASRADVAQAPLRVKDADGNPFAVRGVEPSYDDKERPVALWVVVDGPARGALKSLALDWQERAFHLRRRARLERMNSRSQELLGQAQAYDYAAAELKGLLQ